MALSGDAVTRLSTWALRWLFLARLWLALADSRALPEVVAALPGFDRSTGSPGG